METCYNYTGKTAYFSSDERKWINKIRKLKEEYPDEVNIVIQPEHNDGTIYARIPSDWMKIQPKRKVELTEAQKDVLRERLERMRQASSESAEVLG